jgi:hypothetical protein
VAAPPVVVATVVLLAECTTDWPPAARVARTAPHVLPFANGPPVA